MKGVNSYFTTPLCVHQPYLMNIVADFLMEARTRKYHPHTWYEKNYMGRIQDQIESLEQTGANSFPVIMDIQGPIIKYTDFNYLGTQFYMAMLNELGKDKRVSGVILNIDSGGGMSSGTGEFSDFIKGFEKPIATFTNGVLASAAYNIASGSDMIVADANADVIGSIGSYYSAMDFIPLLEKMGAVQYEKYAPQSDLKNKKWREWFAGNPDLIEADLKIYTAGFINKMKENRGERLIDDGKVFRGEVYGPEEAKQIGLIDEVNSLEWLLSQF